MGGVDPGGGGGGSSSHFFCSNARLGHTQVTRRHTHADATPVCSSMYPRRRQGFTCGRWGVDRALRPEPPPPQKRAQLMGPQNTPKTNPGTSVVPMAVVFVFKDTRPPINSGYMYVAPHHGLPLEAHELVRVNAAVRVAVRVIVSVGVRIRVRVRARAVGWWWWGSWNPKVQTFVYQKQPHQYFLL